MEITWEVLVADTRPDPDPERTKDDATGSLNWLRGVVDCRVVLFVFAIFRRKFATAETLPELIEFVLLDTFADDDM